MKLAIVTPVLGSAGGIGRVAEEQATRLAARGYEVTVCTPLPNFSASQSFNLLPLRPIIRYGYGAWVPQLTRKLEQFDLVHLHYPFLGGTGAALRWKKKNPDKRLVVTYHMDLLGQGMFRPIFRAYQHLTLPRLVESADAIVVSSLDYAEHNDLEPFLNMLGHRLIEIPFGIDLERFKPGPSDQSLRERLGFQNGDFVIMMVGGLNRAHYFKGVSVLLKAFSELYRGVENARLLFVGQGELTASYRRFAYQLGIAARVVFASRVSFKALPDYYRLANVFVLPSIDRSEAFGLVLLEAQASGVPVVASNLPGVRTVFANGDTGYAVKPNDATALREALYWMWGHSKERADMGRFARARMEERYRWDPIIDQLEALYQNHIP